MKKIKYVRFASGLMLFVIMVSISASATVAWGNGKYKIGDKIGEISENPIPVYYNDFRYPMDDIQREYYGTHDWIAESSLELLYDVKPHPFLSMLQGDPITNNMLKIYFLFGTEIPDRDYLPHGFKTSEGFTFADKRNLFPPKNYHTALYFNDDGHPESRSSLVREAAGLYKQIELAFEAKDCQRAAVFIGAMMHLIADATMYNHLLPDVGHQQSYESLVGHLTYRRWERDGTREIPPPGITEFFSVKEAILRLTILMSKHPVLGSILAGRDTRFGYDYGYYPETGVFDARTMSQQITTLPDRGFWDRVKGPIGFNLASLNTWQYADRPTGNSDLAKYFNTIEHNLNTAIYYSAAALSDILDNAGFVGCSGTGEWPAQPDGQDQGQKDRTAIQVRMDNFLGLMFFNMAGLIATGMALTILTQAGIMKKIIGIFA